MDSQGIAITEAAEALSVPYRTLQNQLSGKNRMPASTFAKILEFLQIPVSFVIDERIRLNSQAAQDAIRDVFGNQLPQVDEDLRIIPAPNPDTRSEQEKEKHLKLLAALFGHRYENRLYIELKLPVMTR